MTGEPTRRTPLQVWAALLAATPPLLLTLGVLLVLGARDELGTARVLAVVGLGTLCAVAVAAVVVTVLAGVSRSLVRLGRDCSVVPTKVSTVGAVDDASGRRWFTREMGWLAGHVDTLRLRVRIADDQADRHRRAAEEASAGVFRLVAGLVAAEEGARGQLSAELHDTVAQSLLAARMLLTDGETDRAGVAVDEAEEQVRALMARTRPPELRDGDLAQAVTGLRDDLLRRYGLRVQLDWPDTPRPLPLALAVVVYRFFQEALLNVVKHADSDEAVLRLTFPASGPTALCASVTDRGVGFVPASVAGHGGRQVGLALMRERARLAGGAISVDSRPGRGTTVQLELPAAALGRPPVRPAVERRVAAA